MIFDKLKWNDSYRGLSGDLQLKVGPNALVPIVDERFLPFIHAVSKPKRAGFNRPVTPMINDLEVQPTNRRDFKLHQPSPKKRQKKTTEKVSVAHFDE